LIINTIIFILYFNLFVLSTLGFGVLTIKFFNLNRSSTSFGLIGLIGFFALTFISYITHIFLPHNYLHNFVVHGLGFFFLILFFAKDKKFFLPNFIKVLALTILFLLALFIAKNHEDFPYYHLPYTMQIVENKIQFGIGFFNIAYRTPSSLFYLQSTFFLPHINIYLFHSSGLIILIFANLFLLDNFFFSSKKEKSNFIKILSCLCFVFINIAFARLGAYGTDRGGQIIAFVIFIVAFNYLNLKNINKLNDLKILFILITYIISFKSYFIVYLLIPLLFFFEEKNTKQIFKDLKIIITLSFFVVLFLFINFSNSGCLLYPLKYSCFDNFSWSVTQKIAEHFSSWYELWSKAGATPDYRVQNPAEYVKNFNWVSNWVKNYFMGKGLQANSIILAIVIYFLIFLRSKNIVKKNYKFYSLYSLLILFFLIWFNKHPDLRYGGFVLYTLIFFIPISIYLSRFVINKNNLNKFFLLTVIGTVIIFNSINILRITKSFNSERELYSFKNFPFFNIRQPSYEIILLNDLSKAYLVKEDMCWATPTPCLSSRLQRKTINSYQFFYNK